MNSQIQAGEHRILVVEDDPNERQALCAILQREGYQVRMADSVDKAVSYLSEQIDLVITDFKLGDLSGLDLLRHWKAKSPETMFLMITGHGSTQTVVDAIKAGAYNYLTKPVDVQGLQFTIRNMLRHVAAARKVEILQNRLNEQYGLSNIIGAAPQMQRVFELIRRSAQVFSTVLILGESGTGKELAAEAIHQNSPRRNGPFLAVNCAAMPATLVESELFGHERGAFTGATERRTGCFEAAQGGTLFIDEIGDFDISLQVKLLRVMENRTVTSVGGNKEIKVDTRVVAATSRDIRGMISRGEFREDLYYRLNVLTIELPPLRERLEDIPLLVRRFMDRVNQQNETRVTGISQDAVAALQHYRWPGNVRELLNTVERMMILCDHSTLEMEDLPSSVRQGGAPAGAYGVKEQKRNPEVDGIGAGAHGPPMTPVAPSDERSGAGMDGVAAPPGRRATPPPQLLDEWLCTLSLAELENLAIGATLRRFRNHRTRAARSLGISVRTLQRKLGADIGHGAGLGVKNGEEHPIGQPRDAAMAPNGSRRQDGAGPADEGGTSATARVAKESGTPAAPEAERPGAPGEGRADPATVPQAVNGSQQADGVGMVGVVRRSAEAVVEGCLS